MTRRQFSRFALLLLALTCPTATDEGTLHLPTQQRALQHYRAGQELLLTDAFAKAAEEFRAAIELDPSMALAHYGLGQAYMGLKSYGEAVAAYRRCRTAYEEMAALTLEHGERLNQRIEDELRALTDIQRQIEARLRQSAGNFRLQRELARVTQRMEQLDRLCQRQDRAAQAPPGVSLALGSAYLRAGKLAEAEREYLAALDGNSKMGEAHNNLAYVYMVTGRLQDAERSLKLAEKYGFRVNPEFKDELKAYSPRR